MTRLTYGARKRLSRKSFALPGAKAGKARGAKGSYPIDTKNRARNALSRVSQFGSSAQKAKVRAAVHRKYPGIGAHHGKAGKARRSR